VIETVGGVGAATPVPDKLNGAREPDALLAMEMLELAAPAVVGAKVTFSVAEFPAAIVAPAARPVAVNPLPGVLTDEIVTVAVPVLVTVEDSWLFFPTVTFPKGKLAGFNVSFPTGAAVPVPDRLIVVGEAGSLLVTETVPVSVSAVVGEYVTVRAADCPALMVAGVVIPETPNGAPFTVIMLIFRSDPPELVSVTVEESFVPVVTDPKLTLLVLGLS